MNVLVRLHRSLRAWERSAGLLGLVVQLLLLPFHLLGAVLDALSGDHGRVLDGPWVRPTFTAPFAFEVGAWAPCENQSVRMAHFELPGTEARLEITINQSINFLLANDPEGARYLHKALQEPATSTGMRWAGSRLSTFITADAPITCLYWVWREGAHDEPTVCVKYTGPTANEKQADAFVNSALPELPKENLEDIEEEVALLQELTRKADAGDAKAQVTLAAILVQHDHVERALSYLRLAVEQNEPEANYLLGGIYKDGHGVPRDLDAGLRHFRLAADAGLADAQTLLGALLCQGEEVPVNEADGVRYLRLAVAQGDATAQFLLGSMYADGICGLETDEVEAVRLYKLAAAQGDEDAIAELEELDVS